MWSAATKVVTCLLIAVARLNSNVATDLAGVCQLNSFDVYQVQFGKWYSGAELETRQKTFYENLAKIEELNSRNGMTWQAGIGPYTDMTPQEWRASRMASGRKASRDRSRDDSPPKDNSIAKPDVPDTFDWRQHGNVLTPVKNQGSCGSCWAFSTTGSIEAHHAIKTGQLLSLSEQALVDCDRRDGNFGCDGGDETLALKYVKHQGGLPLESAYKYIGRDTGHCRHVNKDSEAEVSSVVVIDEGDEQAMKIAVATIGPLTVAYDCEDDFMNYKSGVYQSTTCRKDNDDLNHAVLAVGYGEENNVKYWLVKNSWGADWGEEGYFKILRGDNMCGIATVRHRRQQHSTTR